MPCKEIKLGKATAAIVCTRERIKKCSSCRKNVATQQCDFPISKKTKADGTIATCDKFLCVQCAVNRGDLDYCPNHGV